eukprot:scaffold252025_cov28-Tisochrysis_lutea.AAC.4
MGRGDCGVLKGPKVRLGDKQWDKLPDDPPIGDALGKKRECMGDVGVPCGESGGTKKPGAAPRAGEPAGQALRRRGEPLR